VSTYTLGSLRPSGRQKTGDSADSITALHDLAEILILPSEWGLTLREHSSRVSPLPSSSVASLPFRFGAGSASLGPLFRFSELGFRIYFSFGGLGEKSFQLRPSSNELRL
jgi:hypothetical protein